MSNKITSTISLLGPGFIAAIAYVDPGNVASNISAGIHYGYLLIWVLVVANIIAAFIQYQSAKLGLVTGYSLPALIGSRVHNRYIRYAYWLQAETMAIVTDIAEVIGGALALNLLFGLPLSSSGLIIGCISFIVLLTQKSTRQQYFEWVIIAFLCVICIGFVIGVIIDPPNFLTILPGLIPHIKDKDSLLLTASIVGATVMPHAIYLHSGLVLDRFSAQRLSSEKISKLLCASKYDICIALTIAGTVNIALLILAAHSLSNNSYSSDTIQGAYMAIQASFGTTVAYIFALGLLASSVASTSIGAYAGTLVTTGLFDKKSNRSIIYIRRLLTIVPAVILLELHIDITWLLVFSQIILCYGIPGVLIPLMRYTMDKKIMGKFVDSAIMKIISLLTVLLIIILNLTFVYMTY